MSSFRFKRDNQLLGRRRITVKTLHILRSEPDETVEKLTVIISMEDTASVVMLYEEPVDWPALVDEIFVNDRVICWW